MHFSLCAKCLKTPRCNILWVACVNGDGSVSKSQSFALSVFPSGPVCRVRGAISWVKLWLLFTFAQQKHAYSSAKQNHSRCRYSDTQKQLYSLNSCTSKIGNVSISYSRKHARFDGFLFVPQSHQKCPHHFSLIGCQNSKRPLFSCSAQRRRLKLRVSVVAC